MSANATSGTRPLADFRLIRHKQDSWATFGKLFDGEGKEVCVTLERPWVDNNDDGKRDRGVSCITAGTYVFKRRVDSPKHGECFEGQDIPDATNIQIHAANLPDELEGCIALGTAFGNVQRKQDLGPLPGIVSSKVAVAAFMRRMDGVDAFSLAIVDSFR